MGSPSLLARPERWVWAACFVAIAVILVAVHFRSNDPDSALYADLSDRLSAHPIRQWIAPEWWGLWPDAKLTGLFLEHPAGLFIVPAALGRLGIPPVQGAYIVGIAAGLIALLLAGRLVMRLSSREDGRAALVCLQLMPLAFIFRIRDNHEYPMLMCLLAVLTGLEAVTRSWLSAALIGLGLSVALVVKGVFTVPVLMAGALWVALNPAEGSRARQLAGLVLGIGVMVTTAYAYDAAYLRVTGHRFWIAYWTRQLGPMSVESPFGPFGELVAFARHIGFYIVRLLYHPAPWSFALILGAWRFGRSSIRRTTERRAIDFVLIYGALVTLLLSLASRWAERYAFSATFMIGAAGGVVAFRTWPSLRRTLARFDASVPAFPAVVWTILMVLRLVAGPLLPRI
jgi:4-amino-4-deoxy-L-arabinose transferase-like glycosyltransferase